MLSNVNYNINVQYQPAPAVLINTTVLINPPVAARIILCDFKLSKHRVHK